MTLFLLGFFVGAIAAWIASDKHTHAKIACECIRLGGFYVGMRTFHCVNVEDNEIDTSTPEAIQFEIDRQKRKGES
jgi:hypothetical protein